MTDSPANAGQAKPRSPARRAWQRARHLARLSALPEEGSEARLLVVLVMALRAWRRLRRRLREDRIHPRAAALAYHTLLALLPITAVTFALLDLVGLLDRDDGALEGLAARYFPRSAEEAVEAIRPLLAQVSFEAVGLIGLATLLPLLIALVSHVELAMSDIFRTRRPRRVPRLLIYALLVTLAPVGTLLTVRYTPRVDFIEYIDRHVGPVVITALVLYIAFRFLPGARIRNRAAASGAIAAALLLTTAKTVFGIYATKLATGVHLVWGAVAFFPLLLIWVFLAWFIVLFGAEIAAVVQELSLAMSAPPPARLTRMPAWRRRRLRRRRRWRSPERATRPPDP